MSLPSPELISRVTAWRNKIADGTITLDEMKEAVIILRQGRTAAATQPKTKKAAGTPRAKKGPVNADDLLAELG